MAFFFGDGFDCYSAITDAATYWDASLGGSATLALSTNGRFSGSRSVAMTSTFSATPYLTKTSGQNDAVHHFSFGYIQTTALTGTSIGLTIFLYDGATAQCSLSFRTDGLLSFNLGAIAAQITTFAGVVPAANTWYQFEIEIVISNTAGSIAIRRNGNTVNDFSQGGLNTRAGTNNYVNKIGLGSNWNSPGAHVMDDFLWRSDASSLAWLGDIRCYTRMPASDASVTWTRNAGTTNFGQVSEAQQDGATTYNFSSTVGQSDLYGISSISATPGSIVAVTTRAYMQKSDAGTRVAAVQLQSGANNVQGSLTLNTTWAWAWRNDLVDPATSAAWTATGVNNAQIGVTVTT